MLASSPGVSDKDQTMEEASDDEPTPLPTKEQPAPHVLAFLDEHRVAEGEQANDDRVAGMVA